MSSITITGEDTVVLYDKVFNDLADGDNSSLVFNDNIAEVKVGKNGNAVIAKNEAGNSGELTLRILRGSSDDVFLQGKLDTQDKDFASTAVATGSIVKRLGNGLGNVVNDTYVLDGGVFQKNVDTKDNSEADTEQAVAIYVLKFAYAKRGIK